MSSEKPIKHAVSVVIENNEGQVLFALRSPKKSEFPLVWSLPSYFVNADETLEETVARIGRDKLGVDLKSISNVQRRLWRTS
jgi:ADP-ribose pyrophosphatase YjhB (NUDIX family)